MRLFGLIISLFFLLFYRVEGQNCSSSQNLSSNQVLLVNNLQALLTSSLLQEDWQVVDSLNQALQSVYGAEAGLPFPAENYFQLPLDGNCLDQFQALNLAHTLLQSDSLAYAHLWKMAKGMAPPSYFPNSLPLRVSAQYAVGLLQIAAAETNPTLKQTFQAWAIQALDSLATMQIQTGNCQAAFPFPDLRMYNDPTFSPIIQNFLLECGPDSVNVLQNGWIVDDKTSGEFKFDAGVIADCYAKAFHLTGIEAYKNIALSIASYLYNLPLSLNYNYNSFVSMGLAQAYTLNQNQSYLERSLLNIRYGLAPGQTVNGHWVDGHNARSVYHSLMIQNVVPALFEMPENHVFSENIHRMVVKAIRTFVEQAFLCGSSTGYRGLLWSKRLDQSFLPTSLKDSIGQLVCQYIAQSAIDGKYLDVPTMGDYLETELLNSVVQEEFRAEAMVYPNPFSGFLKLSLPLWNGFEIGISFFNSLGMEIELPKTKIKDDQILIETEKLPRGIYFLRVTYNSISLNFRLLKSE